MGNENSGTLVVEMTKQRNKWKQMKEQMDKETNPLSRDEISYIWILRLGF